MKLEEILHNHLNPYFKGGAIERQAKEAMREAVKQALELAIKSFPSHEHPDIAKSIMNVMDEIE